MATTKTDPNPITEAALDLRSFERRYTELAGRFRRRLEDISREATEHARRLTEEPGRVPVVDFNNAADELVRMRVEMEVLAETIRAFRAVVASSKAGA